MGRTVRDFRTGALLAVNLGHDADTVGAVYGQLAGARFGFAGIPADRRAQLHRADLLTETARRLHAVTVAVRVSEESAAQLPRASADEHAGEGLLAAAEHRHAGDERIR